ncbi:MAG: tyrosine-type recombinase/integrase [Erysipelotrichaceae bacterium]|nr:tyrosine-type recombinase/integrase [Erysipelotrichaceae bacterium]
MPANKRKDGRYEIVHSFNGVRKHFYGLTAEEAEEKMWREIIRYKDSIGEYPDTYDTFGDIRRRWYKSKSPRQAATRKMYEIDIFRKIETLDNRLIADIDENDINEIMDPLLDKTNIAEKVYMCLNQIFQYAMVKKIVRYNPMDLVNRPKNKTSNKAKRGLTQNEKAVIEKTVWNKRQELLLKLVLGYGLRKEEATALQKKKIDTQARTISIDQALDYTENVPRIKKPKSDAGKRVLPMLDQDVGYFADLIKNLKDDDYLLQMQNRKPLTQNSYRQLWESIRRRMRKTAKEMKLDIPDDLTSRICRHEYSISIMSLTDREQMYLMGHEDISTTMKNYQTINVEHINRKELNRIGKNKNGSPSSAKK